MRAALRRLLARGAPRLALRVLDLDRAELGLAGETLAARALRRAGWTVLGRRVRTPLAEIDVVVRAPGWVVCVEVKTSRVPEGRRRVWRGGDRLDARTLARQRGAARWLAERLRAAQARVDLVEVEVSQGGRVRLRHRCDLAGPPR